MKIVLEAPDSYLEDEEAVGRLSETVKLYGCEVVGVLIEDPDGDWIGTAEEAREAAKEEAERIEQLREAEEKWRAEEAERIAELRKDPRYIYADRTETES